MIDETLLNKFKEKLMQSNRPLFLFDDDPDGLCSFLLLYRMLGRGNGWPVKTSYVPFGMVDKINNYQADLVVILDKPGLEDGVLEGIQTEVIWLDHHQPVNPKNTLYLNPRNGDDEDNSCTSYWCYRIAKRDLWIAAVGIYSDWQTLSEEMYSEFKENFGSLLSKNEVETALFSFEDMSKLCRIFSFNLKGSNSDVLSSIKILSRVENPFHILNGETSQAKLLLKRYEKNNAEYQNLLNSVEVTEDKLLLFNYTESDNSFTADLSNELLVKHPEKVILISRQKGDSYKCSLRSAKVPIVDKLQKALAGTNGEGGGHSYACGAVIPVEQFPTFLENFRKELSLN